MEKTTVFQYSLADIERLIREDILQRHGHRIIETSPAVTENESEKEKSGKNDGKPGKRRRRRKKSGAFRWTNRPELSVTILAEPDLGALRRVLEEIEERPREGHRKLLKDVEGLPLVGRRGLAAVPSPEITEQSRAQEEEVDIDPTMLPPGADVQMIKQTLQRARLEGETDERPD